MVLILSVLEQRPLSRQPNLGNSKNISGVSENKVGLKPWRLTLYVYTAIDTKSGSGRLGASFGLTEASMTAHVCPRPLLCGQGQAGLKGLLLNSVSYQDLGESETLASEWK